MGGATAAPAPGASSNASGNNQMSFGSYFNGQSPLSGGSNPAVAQPAVMHQGPTPQGGWNQTGMGGGYGGMMQGGPGMGGYGQPMGGGFGYGNMGGRGGFGQPMGGGFGYGQPMGGGFGGDFGGGHPVGGFMQQPQQPQPAQAPDWQNSSQWTGYQDQLKGLQQQLESSDIYKQMQDLRGQMQSYQQQQMPQAQGQQQAMQQDMLRQQQAMQQDMLRKQQMTRQQTLQNHAGMSGNMGGLSSLFSQLGALRTQAPPSQAYGPANMSTTDMSTMYRKGGKV